MKRLTPVAARDRQRLLEHMCLSISELNRQARTDRLLDTGLGCCTLCGAWADAPICRRCTATHHLTETFGGMP